MAIHFNSAVTLFTVPLYIVTIFGSHRQAHQSLDLARSWSCCGHSIRFTVIGRGEKGEGETE